MKQAFIVRQMSSVEVMSRWICLETNLEQGFPSLTSTTVRVSGNFFNLDTILREETYHPSTSPCVFITYGVCIGRFAPQTPGQQEWHASDSSRTCRREVECLQRQEFS
uniref:Uncharacterized protein LOC111106794 n=1 Tax=Crassostrea virginica TaxID=6565 RepID=A0A8B8B3U5_CRAVI|nr:uncharacterized protein LOC111106794 [Crassostrea virginica]